MKESCRSHTALLDVDRLVCCEREFGHGGAHRAEINDYDEDFIYVVSWWKPAEAEDVTPIKEERSSDALPRTSPPSSSRP